jgi:ribonuclease-3
MLDQKKDNNGSPMFHFEVVIEGLQGCSGVGYSKKESQQLASKLTLERLRKEPKFIDSVFAAKANRTKMEEEPVENVPSTEVKDDFIITQDVDNTPVEVKHENVFKEEVFEERSASRRMSPMYRSNNEQAAESTTAENNEEFDLSDISAKPLTREEIIAAAEAAAFEE